MEDSAGCSYQSSRPFPAPGVSRPASSRRSPHHSPGHCARGAGAARRDADQVHQWRKPTCEGARRAFLRCCRDRCSTHSLQRRNERCRIAASSPRVVVNKGSPAPKVPSGVSRSPVRGHHPYWNHLVASSAEARPAATTFRFIWGRANEHTVQQLCEAMGSRTSRVERP